MRYSSGKTRTFSSIDIWDFEKQKELELKRMIENQGKEYILKVDEEEYKEYLFQTFYIEPIKIEFSNEIVEKPVVKNERVSDRTFREEYDADVYYITVKYPFTGNVEVFNIHPSTFVLISGEIYVDSSFVSIEVKLIHKDPAVFQKRKEEMLQNAFANLDNANKDIANYNNKLKGLINSIFTNYKQKYLSENDFFAAINVKINPDTQSVFSAPTVKKKIIPQPKIDSRAEFSSEPTMSNEMYNDLLRVVYEVGKNMEKKPSLYHGKNEEGLRDQFLLVLETRYEGITATGETFNKSGKTDILLKYAKDSSNLFVGECKIWHGAKELHKAISQLFDRYLTWRDSKVALIFFVANDEFSLTLSTVKSEVQNHPYFVKYLRDRGESSFSYIFHLPQDHGKSVNLEIILFHFRKLKEKGEQIIRDK